MQTACQVIDNLLRGKPSERIGLTEGPWADTIAAWVQQGYPTRRRFRKKGQDRWRREDGMWVEAEQDGDFEEPVPAWKH